MAALTCRAPCRRSPTWWRAGCASTRNSGCGCIGDGGSCFSLSVLGFLLPSPLWGGVGGGGRRMGHILCHISRPPTPTLPHKGGGGRKRPVICDCLAAS